MQINNWFIEKFGAKIRNNEANFPCPKCGHESFSFNIKKKVGYCFRAGCTWAPTLKELQTYIQSSVSLEDLSIWNQPKTQIIELPENSYPVISAISPEQIAYNDKEAFEYLSNRGITPLKMFLYKIHSSPDRVIVPIYNNGVLVSYVARVFRTGDEGGRYTYLYPPGARHSETLLNWIESKQWDNISLVENTFVSISLRELNVSTNFGSSLGDSQINKLLNSKIKSVVLLWDENSEPKADKAVKKLRRLGLPACYVRIKGQPDNYSKQTIKEFIADGQRQAFTTQPILDRRNTKNI